MNRTPYQGHWRAFAALLLVLALSIPGFSLTALAEGNVSVKGRVFASGSAGTLSSGKVYAVHLTTKQLFLSPPIDADGAYTLDGLPYGYFEFVVVSGGKIFLANRVMNLPAGESIELSFVLKEPDADDAEWWSAAPDRQIPGLDRAPDGVARIVEDDSALAALLSEQEKSGAAVAAETATSAPVESAPLPAAAGSGFWEANSGWLIPAIVATSIAAGAVVLTEDNDDAEDEPASPFE